MFRVLLPLSLCLTLAVLAVPSAVALPVTGDGRADPGGASLGTMADLRAAIDDLETGFAAHARFGGVAAAGTDLIRALPGDRHVRHLVAAAYAAAGRTADAETALDAVPPGDADAWGRIAEALLARNRGDLAAADRLVTAAIAAAPDNAYARSVAGTIAVAAGDFQAAASRFAEAVERAPEGAVYLANLGAVLAELGDAGLARQALIRALELEPADCTAAIALAGLARNAGGPAAAAELLGRCLADTPAHPEATPRLVAAQLAQGATDAARQTVADHGAGLDDPALALAQIALHAGEPGKARAHLREAQDSAETALTDALAMAMAGSPSVGAHRAAEAARGAADGEAVLPALAHVGLATAAGIAPDRALTDRVSGIAVARFFAAVEAARAGNRARAEAALGEAAEMLPGVRFDGLTGDDVAHLGRQPVATPLALGLVYELAGYAGPARAAYAHAAAAAPEAAVAQLLRARNIAASDPAEARAALTAAVDQAPTFAAARRLLAELLGRAGDFPAALAEIEAALAVHEDAMARLMQGSLAEQVEDDTTARAAYERLIALSPGSFVGYNQLAWFLAERGIELDRALELAERADALQPGNASVLDTKGWILYRQGAMDDALTALREAHAIDGGRRPVITLHLATVEAAAGERDDAIALLRGLVDRGAAAGEFSERAQALLAELEG